MNDKTFPKKFTQALRPGPYFRIIKEGDIGAEDTITILEKPKHDVTLRDVFRIYTKDRHEAERLLNIEQISAEWKRWACDVVQKQN